MCRDFLGVSIFLLLCSLSVYYDRAYFCKRILTGGYTTSQNHYTISLQPPHSLTKKYYTTCSQGPLHYFKTPTKNHCTTSNPHLHTSRGTEMEGLDLKYSACICICVYVCVCHCHCVCVCVCVCCCVVSVSVCVCLCLCASLSLCLELCLRLRLRLRLCLCVCVSVSASVSTCLCLCPCPCPCPCPCLRVCVYVVVYVCDCVFVYVCVCASCLLLYLMSTGAGILFWRGPRVAGRLDAHAD